MEHQMANDLRKWLFLAIFTFSLPLYAMYRPISLKDHYPQKYVVQEGDTLYDIAKAYLNQPWQWQQIWHDNPKVKNPNRIYPGAILTLEYHDGRPYLSMIRQGTYKLSPHARPRPAQKAIPPIHLSEIRPFLNGSRVFDVDELANSAYVVALNGEHLLAGQNIEVYAMNINQYGKKFSFAFYRPNGIYYDPNNKEKILGYRGLYLGSGELVKMGQPATVVVDQIVKGIRIKDRIVPNDLADFDLYFEPQAPKSNVNGQVLDLFGGITQIATNQVIAINLGKSQRVQPGDVIAIWQKPRFIKDPMSEENTIKIPKERIGEAMIFRTFTNISYALIVNSTRAVHKGDLIGSP